MMVTARSSHNAGPAERSRQLPHFPMSWDHLGFRLLVFAGIAAPWALQGRIRGAPWHDLILFDFGAALPFAFLAPIVLAMVRRVRRERPGVWRYLISHLVGMVLVAIPYWVIMRAILYTWSYFETRWFAGQLNAGMETSFSLLFTSLSVPFVYFVILLGAESSEHAADRQREAEQTGRLARQLTEARLSLLQRQVHPHFLFNALQAISTLLHRAPATADRLLVHLSDLLRAMLEDASRQTLSLRTELDLTRKYLEIEQARFEDRLRVEWRVDEQLLELHVPSLVVLPLVENAIRHGLSPKVGPGCLTIRAWTEGPWIFLSVEDDGVGAAIPLNLGLGVGNTRERLDALFGEQAALHIDTSPQRGFRATMMIPLGDEPS